MSLDIIRKNITLNTLFIACLILFTVSCNNGNTHGGEEENPGTGFIGNEDTAGGLEIRLNQDHIATGDISGFEVFAFDANRQPIQNIAIVCDTERGLALVEPTTGTELSSQYGTMSGKLGCSNPGSFQLGCRLPVAGGTRKFVTVICEGDIPTGFTGFTGAGGGGLNSGGGVVDPGNGGPGADDIDRIRVTGFSVTSITGKTSAIDTSSCICNNATAADLTDDTPEPFGDDALSFKVVNGEAFLVRLESARFNVDGLGDSYTLALSDDVAAGATADINMLFLDFVNGGRKRIPNKSSLLPLSPGFRNVTVKVTGRTTDGREFELTGAFGLSFDQYNLCTTGACR